ncbi:DUF4998 domain-containing protein [Mucilaginibacter mali]|uniref:DUF4998 domain-containing protein n=1 Tax=Mucilaginibacter mali TaxID=2740462 RepID=A0A7D4QC76_9SPHI|nr:DUF4998 domain-containing protein [Mucilaginibacter mali]QKJ31044.1 DUF4998 domain-containing protein [Mucilaginibacter mali]
MKLIKHNHTLLYRHRLTFILMLGVTILTSCGKQTDVYKDFLAGGEKIYTGRADALSSYSGNGRVLLTWLLVSDPKITQCKVFWNNKRDSSVLAVKKTANTDTIRLTLNNLPEGAYTFQVYNYDNAGHTSIKSEVIGTVYGDTYAASIANRPINNAVYTATTKTATMNWFGVSPQAVKVEITYTDATTGKDVLLVDVPVLNPKRPSDPAAFINTTTLPNYKSGTPVKYRTGYRPDATAIDIFYTGYSTITPI